jgi:sec-independent protein translocase protein TatB
MFNIGGQEFALIIVLALVVVGPEQLPGLVRKMGQYAAQARQMSSSLRAEFMAATEPMQDTFKEFQEGMNEFQTGMTDLSKTVTDAADVNQWGSGTAEDPVVPRGFADTNPTSPESPPPGSGGDVTGGSADPWAADRVQPITEPTRAKKLEVSPPVNPWDPIHQSTGSASSGDSEGAPDELDTVKAQTEEAARQVEEGRSQPNATVESQHVHENADEEPA